MKQLQAEILVQKLNAKYLIRTKINQLIYEKLLELVLLKKII